MPDPSATAANGLMTSLLTGETFDIPDVDLSLPEYQAPDTTSIAVPDALTNADLTEKLVGGSGTFDVVMDSILAHLKGEFDKNRITGSEYTKAFIAATEAALSNSVQFLLNRDQSYWTALNAQIQAQIAQTHLVKSRVELETSKVQLEAVRLQAAAEKANFALTKLKLATESVAYDAAKYNVTSILPAQLAKLNAENTLIGKQGTLTDKQGSLVDKQSDQITQELTLYPAKLTLIKEQGEAQRAQTMDKRSDNTNVVGYIGKQKDLLAQQITSYQRDSEIKVMKILSDTWITQKTIDEGLTAPTVFTNAQLDSAIGKVKTNLSL
jgi:hypothetical protein